MATHLMDLLVVLGIVVLAVGIVVWTSRRQHRRATPGSIRALPADRPLHSDETEPAENGVGDQVKTAE